jgi:hypothetical protein
MKKFAVTATLATALVLLFVATVESAVPAGAATINIYSAAQSGVPGFESSMAFTPTADPTLYAQLDNQQGSDADSTSYSQAFQIPADGTVNTVTWWGTGANQAGFMVAIQDGVWGSSTSLPNGPVVEGTLTNLSVVPIASIARTPSINGETKYQINIPPTLMYASHAYRLSVTAVGGNFEWDSSSAAGCCGGTTGINWVRGRLQSYLGMGNVSFSLDNSSTPVLVAPVVTSSPSSTSVTAGQSFSFAAAASGSPSPTVQWQVSTDGGATFSNIAGATATTYSRVATLADNASQFQAVFTNGSGAVTTAAASLTVATTTTLLVTSTVLAPVSGQQTKLIAAVTSPTTGTKQVTGGTVTFFDGLVVVASVPVKAGKASVTVAFAPGSHGITARYSGSGAVLASQSPVLNLPVGQAGTVVKVSGPLKGKAGVPVTYAITVATAAPAKGVATGTVAIQDGATILGTVTLDATGKATFTTTALAPGTHTITATYGGDPNHATSGASRTTAIK